MAEGARCAEHQAIAVGACVRCGTFICAACNWRSFCGRCFQLTNDDAGVQRAQELAGYSWKAFLAALGFAIIPIVNLLTPVVLLAGFSVGIWALATRKDAPNVVAPAAIGIVLNGLSLVLMVGLVVWALFGPPQGV